MFGCRRKERKQQILVPQPHRGEEVKNEELNDDNALGYIVRKWGAAVKNVFKM